jgi:hypothetical protein
LHKSREVTNKESIRISVVAYAIEGTTVTYSGTITMGDKPYKMRGTAVFATDLMSFVEKREISIDGKVWMPTFESKSINSKSAPK